MVFENLTKNSDGLVPAVIQNYKTGDVLMLGYMNEDAFNKTLNEKYVWFFSRHRKTLWKKGEVSGNVLAVKSIYLDCDNDTLLIKAEPSGPVCHTGQYSCFYKLINDDDITEITTEENKDIFSEIYNTIKDRDKNPSEGSYTNYLLDKGIDKILKKVGEESAEVIIAAKNSDSGELQYEVSDLIYHLSVLLYKKKLTWEDIYTELKSRRLSRKSE